MKYILLVLALIPFTSFATVCGTEADAEAIVTRELRLDPSDFYAEAVGSDREFLAGGQYEFRRVYVNVVNIHNHHVSRSKTVTYQFTKDMDAGPGGRECKVISVK